MWAERGALSALVFLVGCGAAGAPGEAEPHRSQPRTQGGDAPASVAPPAGSVSQGAPAQAPSAAAPPSPNPAPPNPENAAPAVPPGGLARRSAEPADAELVAGDRAYFDGDYAGARKHYERARTLAPADPAPRV